MTEDDDAVPVLKPAVSISTACGTTSRHSSDNRSRASSPRTRASRCRLPASSARPARRRHVQSSGSKRSDGANVLVALFSEATACVSFLENQA